MYSSKEYQQIAKDNIDYLDILLKNSKSKKLNILKRNFKKSTILERPNISVESTSSGLLRRYGKEFFLQKMRILVISILKLALKLESLNFACKGLNGKTKSEPSICEKGKLLRLLLISLVEFLHTVYAVDT